MADQKISAMSNASALDGTELVPLVQGGANVKTTVATLNAFTTNRIALLSSQTQTATADTATLVTFNNTAFSQNISIANGTDITFAKAGAFVLDFSFQLSNANTQIETVDIWLRLNGVDYALSNTSIDVPSSHGGKEGEIVAAWSIPGVAAANDYVQIVWSTTDAQATIKFKAAQTSPTRPTTPSAIATVFQIG